VLIKLRCIKSKRYTKRMKARRVKWALWVLFVALFAFWWGVAVLASQESTALATATPADATAVADTSGPLRIFHTAVGSQHIYQGIIKLPEACDSVATAVNSLTGTPNHITIALTITRPTDCATAAGDGTPPFRVGYAGSYAQPPVIDGVVINNVIVPFIIEQ